MLLHGELNDYQSLRSPPTSSYPNRQSVLATLLLDTIFDIHYIDATIVSTGQPLASQRVQQSNR